MYLHLTDREEDGLFGDDEEEEAQLGVPKQFYYDEYDDPYDILKMMMNYVDSDAGTCLHLATKVSLLENKKMYLACSSSYHILSRKVVKKKKTQKCTRQDRKVVWVYTRILHIGLEKCTSLYF